MFSINENTYEMILTRGDTLYLDVSVVYEDGTDYQLHNGDRIYFRMGGGANLTKELSIDTTNNIATLKLEPEDTKPLKFTTYKYEFELVAENGDHSTIVANKNFTIDVEQEESDG